MQVKISFHNMPHSKPLEQHAKQKLEKVNELLNPIKNMSPFFIELWLKANKLHPHHSAELHLKTPNCNLHSHNEGADMYAVIDNTIDKMISLVKKEKTKLKDKKTKPETDKTDFSNDKYNL